MLFIAVSCERQVIPEKIDSVAVRSLTEHTVHAEAYELPKGVFRGALWPTNEKNNTFELWLIRNGRELFFDIPPPDDFGFYEDDETNNWNISQSTMTDYQVRFNAERRDKKIAIYIELPIKNTDYGFKVIKGSKDKEMIIFMTITESIIDKGIFGFIMIENGIKSK